MEIKTQDAMDVLQAIEKAKMLTARHSKNNGIVPLVWGLVIVIGLVGLDLWTHLLPMSGRGLTSAAIVLALLPVGTVLWTAQYTRRLPVQPLVVDRPRLFTYWGFYHMAVLWLAIGLIVWLRHLMHVSGLPPFALTLTGFVDAAPLFWIGWRQHQRGLENLR